MTPSSLPTNSAIRNGKRPSSMQRRNQWVMPSFPLRRLGEFLRSSILRLLSPVF